MSMLNRTEILSLGLGLVLTVALAPAQAQTSVPSREETRLDTASQVLEELRASRDQSIPDRLLERAYGIAVVPNVAKLAFIAGGRRGKGLLVVRDKNNRFSNPVFINLTGGSLGWQAGVQSSDIVLVFTTRKGVEGITDGKLTLGGDASVAAGPVGRQASAGTDANFGAEIYSYSRARGLFAGVALDGTALTIDNRSNEHFYGKSGITASDIMEGAAQSSSAAAQRFLAAVATSTSAGPAAKVTAPPSSPSTTTAPAHTTPAHSGAAKTFPMEDAQPGQEPK